MEAVKSFNAELSSLYDVKPPISKAKMTALTRGAIKAIKFYKHVVQSVEKFILKCKPEYKVPGLYVIDSIVRQSRHQFGSDKDVFAPRFAKNMQQTFVNLFRCPPEDKSKVIRVLNLWQKNQVFAPEVIQPLFDLADPNHPLHREQQNVLAANGVNSQNIIKSSPANNQRTPTKAGLKGDAGLWGNVPSQTDATSALAQLGAASLAANPNALQQLSGQSIDPAMIVQLQTLQRLLLRQTGENSSIKQDSVHFDKKLLDFDYGSDEEDDTSPKIATAPSGLETMGSLLSNPEVLRQVSNLQQQLSQQQLSQQQQFEMEEKIRKLQEMKQQEEEFDKHLAQTVPNLPFASECELKPTSHTNSPSNMYKHEPAYVLPSSFDMSQPPPGYKPIYDNQAPANEETMESEIEFIDHHDNDDIEVINLEHTDSQSLSPLDDRYNRRRRSRSRGRSRDRSDRRSRRSRSRSRSRRRRSRSPRDRERDREREREKEKEREKDRERRKRGLPPIKKDNLSVCSTTLWVGHLSKLVHQEDLSDTFGEFGDIVSIDLIPPRGCAFICMNRRQDAARCLSKLKNHKMQGKAITLAWAPGKGVKGKDYKDYWEVDLGVSYIPWSKLKPDVDVELLEEGGMIDEDTIPDWLKAKMTETAKKKQQVNQSDSSQDKTVFLPLTDSASVQSVNTPTATVDTSQPPPLHTGGLLPPPPMAMSLVSPFSINTRLIGPMGPHMGPVPPGMMPNIPIGVPPPNLSGPLLPNQLLGIGSPFTQAPPGMMPPSLSQIQIAGNGPNQENKPLSTPGLLPPPNMPSSVENSSINGNQQSLLTGQNFVSNQQNVILQSEDNMDIEMEDADNKPEKPMPLSDQLLAAISGPHFHTNSNLRSNENRLKGDHSKSMSSNLSNADVDERNFNNTRDNRDARARDRNDRLRDNRSMRNSRDRIRDRDTRDRDRDRESGGRNDRRSNRWSDRDHKQQGNRDHRNERNVDNDKKGDNNRNEKTIAERLRDMAHEGIVPNRDRTRDRSNEKPPPLFGENQSQGPMPDRPPFLLNKYPNGERMDNECRDIIDREDMERLEDERRMSEVDWRERMEPNMYRHGNDFHPDDYDSHLRRHPDEFSRSDHPDFDPRMNMNRPDFEGRHGPMPYQDDMRMDQDRYEYEMRQREMFDRRDNFGRPDDIRMMDDFDHRARGPDFFPHPRDNFGPRPLMRGPGPDVFPPRPLLGRPPGPHMFHPRGMGPRGIRPGPWMEGMRPGFPPRFEGPDGPFFNRMPFDDHHPRYRRHDDRRRFAREENSAENQEKPDRRSRWSGGSPSRTEEVKNLDSKEDVGSKQIENVDENEPLNKEKPDENSIKIETHDTDPIDESKSLIPTTTKEPSHTKQIESNENEPETKEDVQVKNEEAV